MTFYAVERQLYNFGWEGCDRWDSEGEPGSKVGQRRGTGETE